LAAGVCIVWLVRENKKKKERKKKDLTSPFCAL